MTPTHSKIIHAVLCILAGVLISTTAQADTLPLLTIQEGDQIQAWWAAPNAPLSTLEHKLLTKLQQRGHTVLFPDAMAKRPRLSRIYRTPSLSPSNAVNLAGLHHARHVITGLVTIQTGEGPSGSGLIGVQAQAKISLRAVPSGVVLLDLTLSRQSFAVSASDAREQAVDLLRDDLTDLLSGALRAGAAPVGLQRDEPFLLIAGLTDRKLLRKVQKALNKLPEINDARLAWVTEGMVAFDLNPRQQESPGRIQQWSEQLSAKSWENFSLQVQIGSDQPLLRVKHNRH